MSFTFVRFLVAGTVAAAINLSILFLLVEFAHVFYLFASIFSFISAVVANFLMQKFWTFSDRSTDRTHTQFLVFITVNATNILINTALMFAFVSLIGFHYLAAQVIAASIIAVISYLTYQHVVFAR